MFFPDWQERIPLLLLRLNFAIGSHLVVFSQIALAIGFLTSSIGVRVADFDSFWSEGCWVGCRRKCRLMCAGVRACRDFNSFWGGLAPGFVQ